jgi:glutaminyl-peptide cyclotransferase
MTNIVAKDPGASPSIVIIGGHHDTKRMALPLVGANDGRSSAAFLLEMARVLAHRPNKLTHWVVFFDGEEALQRWSASYGLYGSRHFARKLSADGTLDRLKAAIIVDMIADAHLQIRPEDRSTPWLNDLVLNEAKWLGYGRYFVNRPRTIDDDHLSFLKFGTPAVDIIDLDYGPNNRYWHTQYDTPQRCGADSLGIIGAVLLRALSAIESSGRRRRSNGDGGDGGDGATVATHWPSDICCRAGPDARMKFPDTTMP